MRIWHQSFTVLQDLPAYVEVLKQRIAAVVRPDTEVVLHGQIPGTYPSDYPGTDLAYGVLYWVHGLQWLAAAREAQKQGFDAMVLASIAGPNGGSPCAGVAPGSRAAQPSIERLTRSFICAMPS